MKIIPKFQEGGWWESDSSLRYVTDPESYLKNYDLSRIVNPYNYGAAWTSSVLGRNTGRYQRNNFSKEQMAEIENRPYYKNFTDALYTDNTHQQLSDFGKQFLKANDKNLPESLRFYNSDGTLKENFTTVGKDAWNRNTAGTRNTAARSYWGRTDNTGGGQHNIAPQTQKRYYITTPNGRKWVDAEVAESGRYNLRPDNEEKVNNLLYRQDFELTGLKDNPEVSSDNAQKEDNSTQKQETAQQDSDGTGDVGAKTAKLKSLNNGTNKFSWLKPAFLGGLRVAVDNYLTSKAIEEYNPQPPLLDPKQFHKAVYGDYIAKRLGEQQSARYQSMASRPMTSDGSLQLAGQLEAVDRGNQAMLQGQMRDAQQYYATRDAALDQAKENLYNRVDISNLNRQTLAQYNREKEQLKYQGKISNAQNWDRFASIWEDRALAKYDYEEQKKRNMQEQMDALSDQLGVDDSAYKVKFDQYRDAISRGDSAAASKLEAELINLKKKMQLQVYRNMGDRVGITWNKYWDDIFKRDGIKSIKNGGTLRKFQAGGGFPTVQWTPLMGQPYHTYLSLLMSGQSGASSASSKSSSSSNVEKEQSSLLKSMIETLKSGELLPSDMEVISAQLSNFFDIQKYALGDTDLDTIYRGYIGVLNQVNRAKYSANSVKEAKTHLDSNKALNSYAVTQDGEVWVGKVNTQEMGKISVNDAVKVLNGELPGYRILTNADLLEVRAKLPSQAFSDGMIMESATSGTSMEAIAQYVQKFIGQLGTDKQSRDLFTRDFGSNAEQGITVINNLKSRGFTDNEANALAQALSGTGGINSLLEANIATESQLNQAKSALTALLHSLPPNMQALLYLQGRGEAGGSEILTNLVLKGTSSNFKVGINDVTPFNPDGTLGSSSKTGKGSSGSSSDKYTMSTMAQWINGMGEKLTFNINPEKNNDTAWQVTGNTMPLTDMSDKSMEGAFTLQDISGNSTLDLQHAYIGNTKITQLGLGKVLLTDPNITRVALPVTVDSLGGVKPDFDRLKKISEINKNLKARGIPTDYEFDHTPTPQERERIIKPINKAYTDKGLPPKYNENTGKLNFGKYKYFGLIKGYAPNSALDQSNEFNQDLVKTLSGEEREAFESRIKQIDENFKFDNPWYSFITGGEDVYEGIIFIPLRDNIFNSQAGKGSSYAPGSPSTMQAIDNAQQMNEAIKEQGGVNPIGRKNFN